MTPLMSTTVYATTSWRNQPMRPPTPLVRTMAVVEAMLALEHSSLRWKGASYPLLRVQITEMKDIRIDTPGGNSVPAYMVPQTSLAEICRPESRNVWHRLSPRNSRSRIRHAAHNIPSHCIYSFGRSRSMSLVLHVCHYFPIALSSAIAIIIMAAIPLRCNICPQEPEFSDLSHLLTHVSSKGHLSHFLKAQLRGRHEEHLRQKLDVYDQWYEQHQIERLLSERLSAKASRQSVKHERDLSAKPTKRAKARRSHVKDSCSPNSQQSPVKIIHTIDPQLSIH